MLLKDPSQDDTRLFAGVFESAKLDVPKTFYIIMQDIQYNIIHVTFVRKLYAREMDEIKTYLLKILLLPYLRHLIFPDVENAAPLI